MLRKKGWPYLLIFIVLILIVIVACWWASTALTKPSTHSTEPFTESAAPSTDAAMQPGSPVNAETTTSAETEPAVLQIGDVAYPYDIDLLQITFDDSKSADTHAAELRQLSMLPQLVALVIDEYALTDSLDLTPLAEVSNLQHLSLVGHCRELRGLESCRMLSGLSLVDCDNIVFPEVALDSLILARCPGMDWSSIGRLKRLQHLYLEDCFPEDMSVLSSVPGLKRITIRLHFDLVTDASAAETMPLLLTEGADIPDWLPGDHEFLKEFLRQEQREIEILLSPDAASDCSWCVGNAQ